MSFTHARSQEVIREAAATFFQRESSGQSLITVTRVVLSDDLAQGTIFVSVFPNTYEEKVEAFLNRRRRDLQAYLKKHSKLVRIPHFTVMVDAGEKNRQNIESLSNEDTQAT